MSKRILMNAICSICGLTYGSHRADSTAWDQCPSHEGMMDWPERGATFFVDSGKKGNPARGTPSAVWGGDGNGD